MKLSVPGLLFSILFASSFSLAQNIPDCMARGQVLPENNQQVLNWKATTQNQYLNRGHVHGTILKMYPDHSGHHHIEAKIGSNSTDTVEVVYNESFGTLPPTMKVGSDIIACGDYITSNKPSGHFPASPDGAIVHWVHRSPSAGHESGFLVIDGTLCGYN